jgi:hypothetical protein
MNVEQVAVLCESASSSILMLALVADWASREVMGGPKKQGLLVLKTAQGQECSNA